MDDGVFEFEYRFTRKCCHKAARFRALRGVVGENNDGVDGQVVLFAKAGEAVEHALGEVGLRFGLVFDMDQEEGREKFFKQAVVIHAEMLPEVTRQVLLPNFYTLPCVSKRPAW